MKVYFRQHRELLKDSLKTEKVFKSFEDLMDYLPKLHNKILFNKGGTYDIRYYCFDTREGIGSTFICTCSDGILGFAYLKNYLGGSNE